MSPKQLNITPSVSSFQSKLNGIGGIVGVGLKSPSRKNKSTHEAFSDKRQVNNMSSSNNLSSTMNSLLTMKNPNSQHHKTPRTKSDLLAKFRDSELSVGFNGKLGGVKFLKEIDCFS